MTPWISIVILAAVAMTGVYVSWRAGRLDRLHTRLETARASLDAALVESTLTMLVKYEKDLERVKGALDKVLTP